MQYIGGKQKSGGHHIAAIVARVANAVGTTQVTEPFCGGLSVTYRLAQLGLTVNASDACEPLITLYKALQTGWEPPAIVSRDTWKRYKVAPDPADPMTAFCGFGCSRSGAWFSSFVEDYKYTKRRVPAASAARDSLRKKLSNCERATFCARDYHDATVAGVIYCDPPYADSLGYPAIGAFNHTEFWAWVSSTSLQVPVLVSERIAPIEFTTVREWSLQSRITTGTKSRRVERVFVHSRWAELPAFD